MNKQIKISTGYNHYGAFISDIPELFRNEQGQIIYNGRNQIRSFNDGSTKMIVKRFKKPDTVKKIIYSFFRKNKAEKAYKNAFEILKRGFNTPRPIAYIKENKDGLLNYVYYVCEYTDYEPIKDYLNCDNSFDKDLAVAFGMYVAELHKKGIIHNDLNSTNVLFKKNNEKYVFTLIDINRMQFKKEGMLFSKYECLDNLTKFSEFDDAYKTVLDGYLNARGWTGYVDEAIKIKQRHDIRWKRKKQITGLFKKRI